MKRRKINIICVYTLMMQLVWLAVLWATQTRFDPSSNIQAIMLCATICLGVCITEVDTAEDIDMRLYVFSGYVLLAEFCWAAALWATQTRFDPSSTVQAIMLVVTVCGGACVLKAEDVTQADMPASDASDDANNPGDPDGTKVESKGVIAAVANEVVDGTTVYYFRLDDKEEIFEATSAVGAEVAFVQIGDRVAVEATASPRTTMTVLSFKQIRSSQ